MLQALLSRFGYLAILALLTGAGLGVPIPEEATQLGAGALAHQGYLRLPLVIAVCWLGIVLGDVAFFLVARRHGERVLRARPVARVLTPARRGRLEGHLARHAFLSVAVARHASGLRLAAFALAATHGVRLRTFALADGLSALLSVPLVVSVGYLFARHLGAAERGVRRVELAVLAAVVVAVAVAAWVRRRRRARAAA